MVISEFVCLWVVGKTNLYFVLFSLLLELQGESGQAIEAYETALSTALTAKDSQKIWLR